MSDTYDGGRPLGVTLLSVLAIVIGVVYLAVARGLWHGNNASRVIVNVVAVINLATALWLLTQSTGNTRVQAAISIVLALLLLGIVNSGRAKAYFLAR